MPQSTAATSQQISQTARELLPPPRYGKLIAVLVISAALCVIGFRSAIAYEGHPDEDFYMAVSVLAALAFIITLVVTGVRQASQPEENFLKLIPEGADCRVMKDFDPLIVVDRSNQQLYLDTPRTIPFSEVKTLEWTSNSSIRHLNLYLNAGDDPYVLIRHTSTLDDLKRDHTWLLNTMS